MGEDDLMSSIFVGIDVSKDHLDVSIRPIQHRQRFTNSDEGVDELIERMKS